MGDNKNNNLDEFLKSLSIILNGIFFEDEELNQIINETQEKLIKNIEPDLNVDN